MKTTAVFLTLMGCIAVSSCALAQEGPGQQRPPGNQPRASAQAPQEPIPEGLRTVSLEALLERAASVSDMEFLIDVRSRQDVYVGGSAAETLTYPILLAILRSNQLVAVEIQGLVNILPEDLARQFPVPLAQRDDPAIPDDAVVSRVIQMNNMSAPQVIPILRPLLPRYAHLAALPEANKLIIVDRYANVRRLTELLNALDE